MKHQFLFPIGVAIFLAIGCTNTQPTKPAQPETAQPAPMKDSIPKVGGDADEHGCRASAGYVWSALRNECIRVFEAGTALEAKAENLDKGLAAFVVFKADASLDQVELYAPDAAQGVLLTKTTDKAKEVWTNATYTVKREKQLISLYGSDGKLLYAQKSK